MTQAALSTADSPTKWSENLAEMFDVTAAALKREGLSEEQARSYASVVVLALGTLMGGRMYYLPRGDRLRAAMRQRDIYHAWRAGVSVAELAKRYRCTQKTVYVAIKRQRALSRAESSGVT